MRRGAALSIAITLAIGALAMYAPRVCRTIAMEGDSPEIVTAAVVFGVPHPPGYPLYTGIGHLIAKAGASNPTFYLNLSSAVLHAAAVGLVACAISLLTDSAAAMIAGAAVLALSRTFFFGSLYAEVFPLNDTLFALLLVLAIRLGRLADRATWQDSFIFVFLSGLAAAHHMMFALAVPALASLAWPAFRRRARPALIAAATLLSAVPIAAAYALVPIAAAGNPILNWGEVEDFGSLVRLATRQDYGGLLHASRFPAKGQLLERLDVFFACLGRSVLPIGIVLATAGAFWLFRKNRREGTAMILAFIVSGPVFAAMNAIDIHSEARVAFFARFTTMCHVAVGILIGCGVAWTQIRIVSWRERFPAGTLLAAVSVLSVAHHMRIDLSRDRIGAAYSHDLVSEAPDGSLVLLTGDMPAHAALYACAVEHACGERIFVSPLKMYMPWYMAQVRRRHPALSIPTDGNGSVDLGQMIEDEIARRPVLAHPELLDKKPFLAHRFAWAPGPLLVRAYAANSGH
jgi:hypothetical protein